SSAALSVATVACLSALSGKIEEAEIARRAFETELAAQDGRASPTDTSIATHGGGILLDTSEGAGHLWSFSRNDRTWHVHDQPVAPLSLVIGNVGRRAPTGEMVAKAATFVQRSSFGRDVVREIGQVARRGRTALSQGDLPALGECMNRAHDLLTILGVSTPQLDALVQACRKRSFGAKLTGAGGGGCMVALTDAPREVARIVEERGALAYVLSVPEPGVRIQ
ncbi:MAG TPA: mevalonate kinase, partial [Candidatus Thermoplasmatota archaeon]|nr:mevalonate kinase [Candidatus Thermoplasmatota archaeon]